MGRPLPPHQLAEPTTGGVDSNGFLTQATDASFASGNFGFALLPGGGGQVNFYVDDLNITTIA